MNIDYNLMFLTNEAAKAAGRAGCDAELVSNLSDPRLSVGRSVPVIIDSSYAARDLRRSDGTRTLESIQARSIEAFLREQAIVRKAVEEVMSQARQSWLGLARRDVDEMWSDTTFSCLYLSTRELNAIEGGGPETISAYAVIFNVGWDEEHGTRSLKFRDGLQVGFELTV